jgi:hypothetical protein
MVFALVAPCILRQIRVIPNFCDDRDKTSSRMRIMKGDATVIEYLNRGLRHELAAINQYWLHYRLLENWGYGALAKKWRNESMEEMQHTDKLIERIIHGTESRLTLI